MSRYVPLICLALLHMLVDASALLVAPIWPQLETRFGMGLATLSIAFVVQSIPSSLSQAGFGYLRDRRPTPWLLWAGPIVAAISLTLIGWAPHTGALFALLMIGGLGIGAFHPEAAVAAGQLLPEHRTRAISLFMFGGSLGLALGPTLSGVIVSRYGLEGLTLLMPVLIVSIIALSVISHVSVSAADRARSFRSRSSTRGAFDGQGKLAAFLLLVCSVRLIPNLAMDKVLAFVLEGRGFATTEIGLSQSLFLGSASAGMFVMAFYFRPGWERPFMVWCPLFGIPLLLLLSMDSLPQWLYLALLVPAGLILWGTTPAMVSYAQQLFPRGAGFASAITLGMSWGLGGILQAPLTAYFQSIGDANQAYLAFIPCLVLGAIGSWMLPEPGHHLAKMTTDVSLPDLQPSVAEVS